MKVNVIAATDKPVDVISIAAGTCYGKADVSKRRVETCFSAGHMSVFEHAVVTLRIEGISRSCMAQLTRHRHASFCVESQRYCKYDLQGDDWFVVPPSMTDGSGRPYDAFVDSVHADAKTYTLAIDAGVKPEDARYLLPEATKTNLVITLNLRELYHIFDMRLAKSAQWEIRQLVSAIHAEVALISKDWRWLVELWGA